MNKHILFFSERCKHCQQFLNQLQRTKYNDLFIKISIHNSNIKLPPKLKTVPTIIVPNIQKPLEGTDVFNWLQQMSQQQMSQQQMPQRQMQQGQMQQGQMSQGQMQQQNFLSRQQEQPRKRQTQNRPDFTKPIGPQQYEENEPKPYLLEMNSNISDSFSYIDTNEPLTHNFSFLEGDREDIQKNIQQTQKQSEPSEMDIYLQNRDNDPYISKSIARV